MGKGADVMIGFRSARSMRDRRATPAHGMGVGDGSDRTDRERTFARRLADIVGEIGAAVSNSPGGSSGERR